MSQKENQIKRRMAPGEQKGSSVTSVRSLAAFEANWRESLFLQKTNARLITLQAYQLIITAALIAFTVIVVIVLLNRPIKNQYFMVDEQGRVVNQINLLSDPMLSSTKARTFADDCVRLVLNIDFVHYKSQLADSEACFTRNGFVQLVNLLQKQGILAELSKGYSVGSVIPKQANFLRSSAEVRGKQRWLVTGAYIWSLQQGKKKIQYPLNIEVSLIEVGINQSIYGMAIETLRITRT